VEATFIHFELAADY